jgi:peptidoglycan/xylan/chitin deacetylase (PgdA/CDA1 family)
MNSRKSRNNRHGYSLAEKSGIAAFLLAVPLGFIAPSLTALPFLLFLLACLAAPFCPQCSFFLPVISSGRPGSDAIALTIDDGPSPSSTPLLLALLAKHRLRATFFVIGEKAAAYPELIDLILAHGHTIGNHSYHHDNFLMLQSIRSLEKDIGATQDILAQVGIKPLLFRPPIGITNPRLKPVLADLGLQTVTFSCRALDRGNRNVANLAARILKKLRPGDILLLHDIPPPTSEKFACWHMELDRLFSRLQELHHVVPLAELIGQPVMLAIEKRTN